MKPTNGQSADVVGKERIEKLIDKLSAMRESAVSYYLDEMEQFTPNDGRMQAVTRIGILNDLDKHITNLELELKRIETSTWKGGQS